MAEYAAKSATAATEFGAAYLALAALAIGALLAVLWEVGEKWSKK